jgi:hypothetical protein
MYRLDSIVADIHIDNMEVESEVECIEYFDELKSFVVEDNLLIFRLEE